MWRRARIKLGVRVISVAFAVLCVVAYSHMVQRKQYDPMVVKDSHLRHVRSRGLIFAPRVASEAEEKEVRFSSRRILDAGDASNCSMPRESHPGYNSSCSYVLENCMADYDSTLINYLTFVLCDLSNVQVGTAHLCSHAVS